MHLPQNVLHNAESVKLLSAPQDPLFLILNALRSIRPLKFEFLAFEGNVIEPPNLGRESGSVPHFALLHQEGEVDSTAAHTQIRV